MYSHLAISHKVSGDSYFSGESFIFYHCHKCGFAAFQQSALSFQVIFLGLDTNVSPLKSQMNK